MKRSITVNRVQNAIRYLSGAANSTFTPQKKGGIKNKACADRGVWFNNKVLENYYFSIKINKKNQLIAEHLEAE